MVLQGWRDPNNNLWRVLLTLTGGQNIEATSEIMQDDILLPKYVANNLYECQGTTQLKIFYHLTLFSLAISTWIKSINAESFQLQTRI